MRRLIIAAGAVLFLVGGAGAGWWVYTQVLRDPVAHARAMLARGEARGALLELRNAVRKDPGNAQAHLELGRLQLVFSDPVAAEKELQAAQAAGYHGSDLPPLLARSYLAQQKYLPLLKDLAPAGLPPADAAALLVSRSLAQLALRDGPAALASAQAARRLAPTDAEAPLAAARVSAAYGDASQALLLADEALRLDPKLVDALRLKAELLSARGDLPGATAVLDTAVAAAPGLAPLRLARARALLLAGEDARAKDDVDAALKIEPKYTLAQFLRAVLLVRAKDWVGADVALQQIQPLLPQLPRGEYYFALVKARLNQFEQAAESIGHFLARSKADVNGYRLLADIKLKLGQPAEAAAALQRAAALVGPPPPVSEPHGGIPLGDTPEALTRLAAEQLQSGNADSAERDLQQSLEDPAPTRQTGEAAVVAALSAGDLAGATAALQRLAHQPDARADIVDTLTGQVRVAALDFDGARQAFSDAVKAAPTAAAPRINLARLLAATGKPAEGEALLADTLAGEPANIAALQAMVELMLAQGRTDRAVAAVQAARKAAPGALGLLVTEAELHARAGDFAAAAAVLDQASPDDALSAPVLEARAQVQLAQGRRAEAADLYGQILAKAPADLATRRRLIDLLVALGKGDAAERLVSEGLALQPGNSALLQMAAALTSRLHGLDAALAQAAALRRDPVNLPTARMLQGQIYMAAKKYPEAAAAFTDELQQLPFTQLVVEAAGALGAAGRHDAAAALLRDWIAKQPDPLAADALGGLEIETKQFDAAQQTLQAELALRPNDAVTLNNLAWLYQRAGNPQAEATARRAYLLGSSPQAADTLGWILTQNGQTEPGNLLLRQAAAQLPNDPSVAYHLAVSLQRTGRTADAARLVDALLTKVAQFDDRDAALKLRAELGPPPPATAAPATGATPAAAAVLAK